MKRILLLISGVSLLICVASAQRLPRTAVPENYKLTFAPDLAKASFAGDETITVRVLESTSQIMLNAAQIDFQDVTISSGGKTQKAKVTLDEKNEMATLAVDSAIAAGPASITIRYSGILNDQLRGFYLGKDDNGNKYAATQFEATDARRAFPCFDEPAYKATFDITVVADKGMTVISNSPAASDIPGADGKKHTVIFTTTPKMSSYLAAIVVGNFSYIEGSSDGIPIRIYATPGQEKMGAFALEMAKFAMHYYNQYFGIKYPYGKLDFVALADFSAGAMENTGCITFREMLLLTDEKNSSLELRKVIAIDVAHEMAHQWFGDLVTMQWWDDLWLNEGFATWMSSKPIEAWKPEWNLQLDDLLGTTRAMDADSLASTHPIHQNAQTPGEIVELADAITYDKTAAVLRMLETYLGDSTFQAGVNSYLKQHAYANATAADFWRAQTQASKKPVDVIMPTFVNQAGVPMAMVQTSCEGGSQKTTLQQKRYFAGREQFEADNSELWQIPVCLKESASGSGKCELLTQKQQTFSSQGCAPWVYGNAGAEGYYRSGYQPQALRAIAKVEGTALTPAEHIMLLSDVWSSVRVDQAKIGDYLGVVQGLQSERTPAVFDMLAERLKFIYDNLVDNSDRTAYQQWIRQFARPIADQVGWEPKAGESLGQRSLRARLLFLLGSIGQDPQAVAVAAKLSDQFLHNPSSVDHDLAFFALQIAARNGDQAFYDKILAQLQDARNPEMNFIYQQTLTSFDNPALLQKTLDYTLAGARSQDGPLLLGRLMRNPQSAPAAWDFVRAHWSDIEKIGGSFGSGATVEGAGNFCSAQMQTEVKDFFAAHPVPAAERTLKQSLERIGDCVDMKNRQGPDLAAWLAGPSGGSVGSQSIN
ncbi:MAG TPA: M1 family metallopeptidase [Terriglobales bacterium]